MAVIRGRITEAGTGEVKAAKVQVLTSQGHFAHPPDAVLKVGPGHPFFYVERGTEYVPLEHRFTVDKLDRVELDLKLERWTDLPDQGWYPGNTHIHYDEKEKQPNSRLKLEGHVHDFSVTVVSVLRRWDL